MTPIDLDALASAAEAAKRFGDASLGGVDDDTADALIALARAVVRWREAILASGRPWDELRDAKDDLFRIAAQFTTKRETRGDE